MENVRKRGGGREGRRVKDKDKERERERERKRERERERERGGGGELALEYYRDLGALYEERKK